MHLVINSLYYSLAKKFPKIKKSFIEEALDCLTAEEAKMFEISELYSIFEQHLSTIFLYPYKNKSILVSGNTFPYKELFTKKNGCLISRGKVYCFSNEKENLIKLLKKRGATVKDKTAKKKELSPKIKTPSPGPSIEELPMDVLSEIMSHIPPLQREAAMQASKKLKKAATSSFALSKENIQMKISINAYENIATTEPMITGVDENYYNLHPEKIKPGLIGSIQMWKPQWQASKITYPFVVVSVPQKNTMKIKLCEPTDIVIPSLSEIKGVKYNSISDIWNRNYNQIFELNMGYGEYVNYATYDYKWKCTTASNEFYKKKTDYRGEHNLTEIVLERKDTPTMKGWILQLNKGEKAGKTTTVFYPISWNNIVFDKYDDYSPK